MLLLLKSATNTYNIIYINSCPTRSWLRGYTTFSYSTQLSMNFIMLINVKMPTIIVEFGTPILCSLCANQGYKSFFMLNSAEHQNLSCS